MEQKDKNGSIIHITYYKDIGEVDYTSSKQPATLDQYVHNSVFTNVSPILFVGVNGYTATFVNPTIDYSETDLILENNGHIYELGYSKEVDTDTAKKILSTFKFVQPSAPIGQAPRS